MLISDIGREIQYNRRGNWYGVWSSLALCWWLHSSIIVFAFTIFVSSLILLVILTIGALGCLSLRLCVAKCRQSILSLTLQLNFVSLSFPSLPSPSSVSSFFSSFVNSTPLPSSTYLNANLCSSLTLQQLYQQRTMRMKVNMISSSAATPAHSASAPFLSGPSVGRRITFAVRGSESVRTSFQLFATLVQYVLVITPLPVIWRVYMHDARGRSAYIPARSRRRGVISACSKA